MVEERRERSESRVSKPQHNGECHMPGESGTSVEAAADSSADWMPCRVSLDGDVVAEQRADDPGAVALREKTPRIGPQ